MNLFFLKMNVVTDARCYNTIQKQSDGLRNALQGM